MLPTWITSLRVARIRILTFFKIRPCAFVVATGGLPRTLAHILEVRLMVRRDRDSPFHFWPREGRLHHRDGLDLFALLVRMGCAIDVRSIAADPLGPLGLSRTPGRQGLPFYIFFD